MEEEHTTLLHYQMLEYLFNKCRLAVSCFNHTWEDFLAEYPEYRQILSENELKNIFWTHIAPNIEEYQLLTEEMFEYFYRDGLILDLSDENLNVTLETNEPRKELDYVYWKSEDKVITAFRTRNTLRDIAKVFEEPITSDNFDIKLNIIACKPPAETQMYSSKFDIQSLEVALFDEADKLSNVDHLTIVDITNRLTNTNLCTDFEHLGIFSNCLTNGMQSITKQSINLTDIPQQSAVRTSKSVNSLSMLSIPEISRLPSRSMPRSMSFDTPILQHSGSRRTTPSRSLQRSGASTPSRSSIMTRSRRALATVPALNLKMSKFMEMHEKRNK